MTVNVKIKLIKICNPDNHYDETYYKVSIVGKVGSRKLKDVFDYLPPDNDPESGLGSELGALPEVYGTYGIGNDDYYELLKQVMMATSVKTQISPNTLKTFEDIIDEL